MQCSELVKLTIPTPQSIDFVPCSGFNGDNLSTRSPAPLAAWYTGKTLLELIDALQPPAASLEAPLRMCVSDFTRVRACVRGEGRKTTW